MWFKELIVKTWLVVSGLFLLLVYLYNQHASRPKPYMYMTITAEDAVRKNLLHKSQVFLPEDWDLWVHVVENKKK